jgi:hypothetical protein
VNIFLIIVNSSNNHIWVFVKLLDIIRITNLGVFQFLIWSFVIMFSSFAVFIIGIFSGFAATQGTPLSIPYNLLTIMGISAAVCVISIYLSRNKDFPPGTSNNQKGILPLSGMIREENHKISLPKVQMLFWTWILVAIYLIGLFLQTANIVNDRGELTFPDIHPAFVVIMLVSQGAFIGNILMTQRTMKIMYVMPRKGKADEIISIFGTNFGTTFEKGAVWLDDAKDHQIRIPDNHIMLWSDDRIEIKLPKSADNDLGCYYIRVVAAGRTTEQTNRAKVEKTKPH